MPDASADYETPRFTHKIISELVWNECLIVPTYDDDIYSCTIKKQISSCVSIPPGLIMLLS